MPDSADGPTAPSGILNIDKGPGMTSHDVVGKLRRLLHTKRVGHAGTLDPDAVGVLVVAVGRATRLLPYLPTEPKVYVAQVAFGTATDTEDASGKVTAQADASGLTRETLLAALPAFTGDIAQVPPMVSAVHHEGKRLYELARAGVTVEREARTVTIHEIRMADFTPGTAASATLHVSCGGGTYIRTLCADLGAALGLPAHMASLRREAVGPFLLEDALSLEALAAMEAATDALTPIEQALDLPMIAVGGDDAARLDRGQTIPALTALADPDAIVGLLYGERLRALARYAGGEYHPFRVFPA